MSKYYLTVVYEVDGSVAARTILDARPWKASSHSNSIHDCDAARLEIASLHAQLAAIGAGEPLRKRPEFGPPGTRDVDVAAAQKTWDAAQAQPAAQAPAATVRVHNKGGAGEFRTLEGIEALEDGTQLYAAPQPAAQALDAPTDTERLDFLVEKAALVKHDSGWKASLDVSVNAMAQHGYIKDLRAAIDAAIAAQQGGA